MKKPNFSDDTKLGALNKADWCCEECRSNNALSCHHRKPNTVPNRNKYGDNIQRIENLVILCEDCHSEGSVKKKWKIDRETLDEWKII